MDYDCKVQLDEIFGKCKSCGANLKFDYLHLRRPRLSKKEVFGNITIEEQGNSYKIPNNFILLTSNKGKIFAEELQETDNILNWRDLEKFIIKH